MENTSSTEEPQIDATMEPKLLEEVVNQEKLLGVANMPNWLIGNFMAVLMLWTVAKKPKMHKPRHIFQVRISLAKDRIVWL